MKFCCISIHTKKFLALRALPHFWANWARAQARPTSTLHTRIIRSATAKILKIETYISTNPPLSSMTTLSCFLSSPYVQERILWKSVMPLLHAIRGQYYDRCFRPFWSRLVEKKIDDYLEKTKTVLIIQFLVRIFSRKDPLFWSQHLNICKIITLSPPGHILRVVQRFRRFKKMSVQKPLETCHTRFCQVWIAKLLELVE
jgi:hypothetical protein